MKSLFSMRFWMAVVGTIFIAIPLISFFQGPPKKSEGNTVYSLDAPAPIISSQEQVVIRNNLASPIQIDFDKNAVSQYLAN